MRRATFIGRQLELRTAMVPLRNRHGGVILTGSAGVGKSRLLHEICDRVAREGWTVHRVLGAHALRPVTLGALARFLPVDPPPNEALLLAEVQRNLLGAGGHDRPVFVAVDDGQLLDDASISLLADLAHRREIVVGVTVRTPDDQPRPLRRLLQDDEMTVVEVGPLPESDVMAMAQGLLGGPLAPASMDAIAETVRGNPLFLRELLTDADTAGSLVATDAGWELRDPSLIGTRLHGLVEGRVDRLPDATRTALVAVAVAEPVELALVDEPVGTIAALEEAQLVTTERSDAGWEVRTDHPVIGEALRRSLPISARVHVLRTLCGRVVDLDDLPTGLAARASRWFDELGETLPGTVASAAAWDALLALDLESARTLAAHVADDHWRGAYVLGAVARAQGDLESAATHLDRAMRLADDDIAIRFVAMELSGLHAFHRADSDTAVAVLQSAANAVTAPNNRHELLCEAAFHATLQGDFDQAIAMSYSVLGEDDIDDMTTWTAAINLGYAKAMIGDVTDLWAVLERAGGVSDSAGREHPAGRDLLGTLLVSAADLDGDIDHAVHFALDRLDDLRRTDGHRGLTASLVTETLLMAGDPRALDVALESVEQLRSYDPYNNFPFGLGYAALLGVLRDEGELAEELLSESSGLIVDNRSRTVPERARAALVAQRDLGEAAALARASGLRAIDHRYISQGVLTLYEALAYGDTGTAARIIDEHGSRSTAPLLQNLAAVARGALGGDPSALRVAADRLLASGAGYLAGIAYSVQASVESDPSAARRAAACAQACAHRAGMSTTPWAGLGVEDTLSRREVDVAVLVAAAASDRDVAEQLFLSTRTVGNHLHRIYAKLDLDGRDALTLLIGRDVPR